jgi:D-3-phosphoglycerate dehydrogenase
MLTNIMPVFSAENINIENMTNKSKGNYAYSVFDVNTHVNQKSSQELEAIPGMIRVRVIQ